MQADDHVVHPLRIARVELGLTQEELAQAMGLGVSTIRRAEHKQIQKFLMDVRYLQK